MKFSLVCVSLDLSDNLIELRIVKNSISLWPFFSFNSRKNGNFEFTRGALVRFVPNEPDQNDYQITYLVNAIEISY